MKLTKNDRNYLMKNFPNVKLSYVKNIHKKVSSANIFLAIPKGQKYFAWFRHFKRYSVCFFIEYDSRKRRIKNIFIKNCCFDETLCINKGTILYGTIVEVNSQPFYFIEDIYFNKGIDLKSKNKTLNFNNIFLGPKKNFINKKGIKDNFFSKINLTNNYITEAANKLIGGEIIATYYGSSEVGPRSLGNTSILCNAANYESVINLNLNLRKDRITLYK